MTDEQAQETPVKKKTAVRKKPGPKSSFRPSFTKLCYNYALLGATNPQMAEYIGVSLTTFEKWLRTNEKFAKKVRAGKADADAKVAKSLYRRARGYSLKETHVSNYQGQITKTEVIKNLPPDTTAMIFWLKNRKGDQWRDKRETQIDANLTVTQLLNEIDGQDTGLPRPIEGNIIEGEVDGKSTT